MPGKLRVFFVTVLLFVCGTVSAQHYIGVKGGYGGGTGRFYPPEQMKTQWGLYSSGVMWKYYSPEKVVGGVEIDVEFLQTAFGREVGAEQDSIYSRKISGITVPLFWQPHVYLFDRHLRVFLNAGVTVSYNFHSTWRQESTVTGGYESGVYQWSTPVDNRFSYGLCGGGGINLIFGRYEILSEVRVYYGYGDILRNRNKYMENPLRSPLDAYQLSLGMFYRFTHDDILSPRTVRRKTEKMDLDFNDIPTAN